MIAPIPITLTADEHHTLQHLIVTLAPSHAHARAAQILLRSARGDRPRDICAAITCSPDLVSRVRRAWTAQRLAMFAPPEEATTEPAEPPPYPPASLTNSGSTGLVAGMILNALTDLQHPATRAEAHAWLLSRQSIEFIRETFDMAPDDIATIVHQVEAGSIDIALLRSTVHYGHH
jgi:hypothetical protein